MCVHKEILRNAFFHSVALKIATGPEYKRVKNSVLNKAFI
jgi:hypothetical protein